MPAFVSQGLDQVETQAPDVKSTEYPRVFDEDGFSIDIVPMVTLSSIPPLNGSVSTGHAGT
jgi:hypothetical protein